MNAKDDAVWVADTITQLRAENARLRARLHAFRNVDDLDWRHLILFIPDSGHGKFWKEVFQEFRASDEQNAEDK